jgi:hypothetical protein
VGLTSRLQLHVEGGLLSEMETRVGFIPHIQPRYEPEQEINRRGRFEIKSQNRKQFPRVTRCLVSDAISHFYEPYN